MGKINLLYVVTKLELGGAQKHVLTLIRYADTEKYNLFLFTAQDGFLMEEALSIQGLVIQRSRFFERSINPFKDIFVFFEIVRFIRAHRIEIIHTHSSKAGILGRFAAKGAGVKAIIHTVHGWPFHGFQSSIVRRFFIWLERSAARFTDLILVVSDADRARGLSAKIGTLNQYCLIRLGLERGDFVVKGPSLRSSLGINEGDLVVGMVACLKPQKAPHDFVRLARVLTQKKNNLKFIVAGDGLLRRDLEKSIRRYQLSDSVLLLGWRLDIPEVLAAMDVFVLTSLWEGLPVSVLEAMAAGKSVVVTDTGGISEIIRDSENGFLIRPGAIEAMAEKVGALLQSPEMRQRMGERAGQSIDEQFSVRSMIASVAAAYEKVNSARGRAHAG